MSPTDSVKVGAAGSIKRASVQTGLCKSSQHTNGLHIAALRSDCRLRKPRMPCVQICAPAVGL